MLPEETHHIRQLTQIIPPSSFKKIYKYQIQTSSFLKSPVTIILITSVVTTTGVIGILAWITFHSKHWIQNLAILMIAGFLALLQIIILLQRYLKIENVRKNNIRRQKITSTTITITSAVSFVNSRVISNTIAKRYSTTQPPCKWNNHWNGSFRMFVHYHR